MSDLDADGNVDYSNIPAYTLRGKQSNVTDTRRSVGEPPQIFLFPDTTRGSTWAGFQSIADLTGVRTCTEGIEIIIHGSTHPTYQKYRSR